MVLVVNAWRTVGYYRPMGDELFVPEDFAVPDGLTARDFRLTPLGPQHNEADYAAWTSSIDHIRATPGFRVGNWPREMSLAENLRDLQRHARDFADRRGFTYTVLSIGVGDVIGCVYIYISCHPNCRSPLGPLPAEESVGPARRTSGAIPTPGSLSSPPQPQVPGLHAQGNHKVQPCLYRWS